MFFEAAIAGSLSLKLREPPTARPIKYIVEHYSRNPVNTRVEMICVPKSHSFKSVAN